MVTATFVPLLFLWAGAAQAQGTTTLDATLDLRARSAEGTPASSQLFSSTFLLRSDALLGTGSAITLGGANQYGAFRWQHVSVETELHLRKNREDGTESASPLRVEAGIVRLPFGLYDYRETYSSGIITYPLPRVDYAYDSVDWSVPGVRVTGNFGNYQIETALFGGQGAGVWGNLNGVDGKTVRLQAYAPPDVILGFSGWLGHQAANPGSGQRREKVQLGGFDGRYTRSHLLLRGELLAGTLAGDTTRGGYLDAYYRLPGRETITLVARGEALKPATDQPTARQMTVGVRWNFRPEWTLSSNYQRNNSQNAYSFNWTAASYRNGALLFQLLRRFTLR